MMVTDWLAYIWEILKFVFLAAIVILGLFYFVYHTGEK